MTIPMACVFMSDTWGICMRTPIPHSHQNLSCLRNGVDYSRFIGNDTSEELLTPLLRQLNFWRESGI